MLILNKTKLIAKNQAKDYWSNEKLLIDKIQGQLRKMTVIVKNLSVVLFDSKSTNPLFLLSAQEIKMNSKAKFWLSTNGSVISFADMSFKISFVNIKLSSITYDREIINMKLFSMIINETVNYCVKNKQLQIKGQLSSSNKGINIMIDSKELGYFLKLIILVVDTIDLIEDSVKMISTHKQFEIYEEDFTSDFNFSLIDGFVFDEVSALELQNLGLSLKIEVKKFRESKIVIDFSPIHCSVKELGQADCGSLTIGGFSINIASNPHKELLELIFSNICFTINERELLFLLKLSGDLIGEIIYDGEKKDFELYNQGKEKKQKQNDDLFIKIKNTVGEIRFGSNSLKIKMKSFDFFLDNYIYIPKVKGYLRVSENKIVKRYMKIISVSDFRLNFFEAEDLLKMSFGGVTLFINFIKQVEVIVYAINYFIFMPSWLVYFLLDRHIMDDQGRLIFITNKVKKSKLVLEFYCLSLIFNSSPLCLASVYRANPTKLASMTDSEVIKYLKSLRKNQFTLEVQKFMLTIDSYVETKVDQLINYLDFTNETTSLNMTLSKGALYFEDFKLFNLRQVDFSINKRVDSNSYKIDETNYNNRILKDMCFSEKHIACTITSSSSMKISIVEIGVSIEDKSILEELGFLSIFLVKEIKALDLASNCLDEVICDEILSDEAKFTIDITDASLQMLSNDTSTKNIFNKLKFSVDYIYFKMNETEKSHVIYGIIKRLVFGIDPNETKGYPFLILPLLESHLDLKNDIYLINIPGNIKKTELSQSLNLKKHNELSDFINETRSFTLFLNYQYLSIFNQIFDSASSSTFILYIIKRQKNLAKRNENSKKVIMKKKSVEKGEKEFSNLKIIAAIFDLKIIYMLDFKPKYYKTFTQNFNIKENGYFGYIIRQHSFGFKMIKEESGLSNMELISNLVTISFLSKENFADAKYFIQDTDIKDSRLLNLKDIKMFNKFFEIKNSKPFLVVSLKDMIDAGLEPESIFSNATQSQFLEINYDSNGSIMKMFDLRLTLETEEEQMTSDVNLRVRELKVLWNRLNKDIIDIIIFDDILLIIDNILLKVENLGVSQKKEAEEIDLSNYSFNFELIDPQFTIQNEVEFAVLLLSTRKKCQLIVQNICLSQDQKHFDVSI